MLLWAGPFLLLLFGAAILFRRIRQKNAPEKELTDADRQRAAKLLE
jgi:cytochrome c-type biogenesis protein CcmH/NrfF